ncbi:nucleotidyltransferase [Bacillus phage 000TH008]|nr:nucleotidyltransferase [Bacillus phage 000TH008]
MDHKESFTSVVGSHNYNLVTTNSDIDKLMFVYPNFEDMYQGTFVKDVEVSKDVDIAVHDVRKIPEYFLKSSPNFLEILFSVSTGVRDELFTDLRKERDRITKINLPSFYEACRGMFTQQYKKGRKMYIDYCKYLDKDDIDVVIGKHIASALRIYNLLTRFHSQGFSHYEDALWYEDGTEDGEMLKNLKTGRLRGLHGELLDELENHANTIMTLKKDYRDNTIDYETKEYVDEIVQKYVKNNLKAELRWVSL